MSTGAGEIVQVDLWELFKNVGVPGLIAGVAFLWRQINKIRDDAEARSTVNSTEIAALRLQLAASALDYERRYVNSKHIDDIRNELLRRFDRIETRLDRLHAPDRGEGEAG